MYFRISQVPFCCILFIKPYIFICDILKSILGYSGFTRKANKFHKYEVKIKNGNHKRHV